MSALVHCIYTSVERYPLPSAELSHLMHHSRANNQRHGITGILLHVQGTFFQVLEGPQEAVEALYAKILLDPRHTKVTKIIFETIPKRFFGESDMSLELLTPIELSSLLQEEDGSRRETVLSELDEGRAKRLLRAFSEGRWRNQLPPAPPSTAVRA